MTVVALDHARRIAVRAQALDGTAKSVLDVVRRSGGLQLDPTAHVAPNHVLAVWSRLGRHDEAELRRLIARRVLVEYDAYIIPAGELPLRLAVRRLWYAKGRSAWPARVREWLDANAAFVRYVLRELERRGPLSSDQVEDRAAVSWPPPPAKPSSGWNSERNKTMLLELLEGRGRVLVSGRAGGRRLWDLAERVVPVLERIDDRHVPGLIAERRVRWFGIVRPRQSFWRDTYGTKPDYDAAGARVTVSGVRGDWIVRRDLLRDAELPDRLTLLSPFDRLIHDRERARDLFGFDFTMEIYVPRAKRKYGYFAMPVLRAERLIARIDPEVDRAKAVLRVNRIFPEPRARVPAAPLRAAVESLAATLGVRAAARPGRTTGR
ncbi:MAG TPA: crosslink repair DNA glycosylase YcaQ family protein [Candidatus Limnocylindria bacterium]|nr:crosslink repair DNA glycosylase YcaQ family protein [Candidatus Limnocylindria bacterium]